MNTLWYQLGMMFLMIITFALTFGGIAGLIIYLNPGEFEGHWPSDE